MSSHPLTPALRQLVAELLDLGPGCQEELDLVRERLAVIGAGEGLDQGVSDAIKSTVGLLKGLHSTADGDISSTLKQVAIALGEAADLLEGREEAAASNAAASFLEFDGPALLGEDCTPEFVPDIVEEFLDHLRVAESATLALEGEPDSKELLATIFRAFHTIKGTCSFLGLDRIQRLAHLTENLLSRARDGALQLTGDRADVTLRACDVLRTMIEGLLGAAVGDELTIPDEYNGLLASLVSLEGEGSSAPPPSTMGQILIDQGTTTPMAVENALDAQVAGDPRRVGEILVEQGDATPASIRQALSTQIGTGKAVKVDAMVRVSSLRLDSLIDMVGELVIAHSTIVEEREHRTHAKDGEGRKIAHLGKITRELQDLSMALRMVPLEPTFERMRRVARDLARKSGKSIQLVTEGEGTEIDRTMVEAINDPLVHMIRNSMDHGIEPEGERKETGKPGKGTLTLRAFHLAGDVVIEIEDDGQGLDRELILAKAVKNGLVPEGRTMSDSEVFDLIFSPGFSTAKAVTEVSGRGVGMDVVKRGIEGLRGRVAIRSKKGEGTIIALYFPLTMAIIDAMLVVVGGERYLLPTMSIQQSFHPDPASITRMSSKGETVMFRDKLLPIVRLHEVFDVEEAETDLDRGILIAVDVHGDRIALFADKLLGQRQVVVKALGGVIGEAEGVSGGAILGDGNVSLVLDIKGIMGVFHDSDGTDGLASMKGDVTETMGVPSV